MWVHDHVACISHSHVAPQASRYHLNVHTPCRLLGSDREAAADSSRATKATLSLSLYRALCEYLTPFHICVVNVCVSLVQCSCAALSYHCEFSISVVDTTLGSDNVKWALFYCSVNDLCHWEMKMFSSRLIIYCISSRNTFWRSREPTTASTNQQSPMCGLTQYRFGRWSAPTCRCLPSTRLRWGWYVHSVTHPRVSTAIFACYGLLPAMKSPN